MKGVPVSSDLPGTPADQRRPDHRADSGFRVGLGLGRVGLDVGGGSRRWAGRRGCLRGLGRPGRSGQASGRRRAADREDGDQHRHRRHDSAHPDHLYRGFSRSVARGRQCRLARSPRRQWRKWRTPLTSIDAPARVDRCDDLRVAHRAAGLDERRDPAGEAGLDAVREREERVRRAARPGRRVRTGDRPGLLDGLARGIHAARLAAAQTDQPAVADEHDRVARHAPAQPPGEVEVAPLGVGRGPGADDAPGRRVVRGGIGRGDEDGPAGGPEGADRRGRAGRRPSPPVPCRAAGGRARAGSASWPGSPAPRDRTRARRRPRGRSTRAPRPPPRRPGG